jgi:hypothetical protein
MERGNTIIEVNVDVLTQGIDLIGKMGACHYSSVRPPFFKGGVGSHFRHCIDFYNSFLSSLTTGRVNYAARKRNQLVESCSSLAVLEIETIIEKLRLIPTTDLHKQVEVISEESSGPLDLSGWSCSTVMRELQSLLSHTIHHYAIIALALRLQGFDPPEEFGVAPSTLAYWRHTA